LRGKAVDKSGSPVPDATARLYGMGERGDGVLVSLGLNWLDETDAEGHFQFRGLWPGDRYRVDVEAKGYETGYSEWAPGVADRLHELRDVVLHDAMHAIQGRITDSRGAPLENVQVFNTGDAPRVLITKTDQEGQFRLEGFRTGQAYVFAEKDGYRFTAEPTKSGATNTVIKLLRKDEPIPRGEPSPQPDEDLLRRQREMAGQVLEEIWSAGEPRHYPHSFIRLMGRVDLEKALEWAGDDDFDAVLARIANAENLIAEGDVDGAFAVLPKAHHYDVFREVIKLAERFIKTDPAAACRLVDEARRHTTGLDEAKRVRAQAKLDATMALMNKEVEERAELKSLDERIESVESVGDDRYWSPDALEARARAMGQLAVEIADRDSTRAWSLIDRALNLCVFSVPPWDTRGKYWDERPVRAAILALQANSIGYPDMDRVYHRAIASRMERSTRENMTLVILLALSNRDLAREVLNCMESQVTSRFRGRWIDWTLAWALVGDDQFPELARQHLAEAKGLQARDRAILYILEIVDVLTAAPSLRPERVMKYRGGL